MSLLKKLAGQTAIYGISTILGRLLNIILTPIYTAPEVFSPAVYGIYTDLYAQIAIVNIVLIFGMETTFFRFNQEHKDERFVYSQAFQWVLLMAGSFLILGLLCRQMIANGLGYGDHPEWLAMTIGVIFLDVVAALPMARLRHQERAAWFASINLLNIVLTISLNLIFLFGIEVNLSYVFLANLIASGVRVVLSFWKNLPATLRPQWDYLKDLVNYGFYIMIAGAAGMLAQMMDRFLLTRVWEDGQVFEGTVRSGIEMTGLYGSAYKVAVLIGLATQAFRYAVEPFYFKEAGEKNSPETFARVFHFYLIAAMVGFLLLASFVQELVTFEIFGKTFVGPEYWSAIGVVPILLFAYVLNGAYVNLSIWFKITKQVRFAVLFTGTGALIVLVLNLITIPKYGYYGSAWATLIAFAVMSVLVYRLGQKYYPIPYRIGRLALYAATVVLAYFVNRWIGPTDGYWIAFLYKLLVCLVAIGGIFAAEKYLPSFGKNG